MAIFYEKARKSRHFAKKRINVAKFWVVPLWGAEPILNGFRPSDGIQSIMAKKHNPEILGCAPLRGGTHSILAYSLPVLSRKIVEYVCFSCYSHHPQEFFCLEGRNPFYLGKKAELRKFWILTSFYHPCYYLLDRKMSKMPLLSRDTDITKFGG